MIDKVIVVVALIQHTIRESFMNDIELFQVEDIMRIFHASRVTVYRWLALARQGKHGLPLPVGGHKQRLLWSRASIEEYCRAQSAPSPEEIAERERRQRQDAAVIALLERYEIPYALPSEQDGKISEDSANEDQSRVKVSGPTYRMVKYPRKGRR